MCGLAGIFDYQDSATELPDEALGLKMLDMISHRGPDDGGLVLAPGVLFGHRRLSILDLSVAGHQPMSDSQQRCWIAFNGEIYNFRELRSELQQAGHVFKSQTDTEVILRGYQQWGRAVVTRLNGMFAFAIWDRDQDLLWLARDLVGIKPLFYHDDGSRLRFGSEIKAILADDRVPRQPDWPALDRFLTFGYTPAPATGFESVRQLLPGESLWVRRGQQPVTERWAGLPYTAGPTSMTESEAVQRLESSLDAAVKRQLVSDVPLGAFLSGGLDSSAVVRSMTDAAAGPVQTFTVGFQEASFDESGYAQQVAQIFGTQHHSRQLHPDAASLLEAVVTHAEEPFADNSAIPVYLLSQFTRQHVTVALSGDGADELLAGYDTYRASQLAPHYRRLPKLLRRGVAAVVQQLPTSRRKYGLPSLLRRFVAGAERPFPLDHCSWRRIVSAELRQSLYTPEFQRQAAADPLQAYASTLQSAPDWLTPLEQQLHLDLSFHLPGDMLVKVDRMSMAHSLEVRVPFLDTEVVKTCLTIPPQFRRQGRRGKLPLKQSLRKNLPESLVDRRKAGFLIPLEGWLRTEWQPLLRQTLTQEFAEQTGMLQWKTIRQMLDEQSSGTADHAYALFALLVLGLWWRMWITGERPLQRSRPDAAVTQVQRLVDAI